MYRTVDNASQAQASDKDSWREGDGLPARVDLDAAFLRRCFSLANICLLSDHARHDLEVSSSSAQVVE